MLMTPGLLMLGALIGLTGIEQWTASFGTTPDARVMLGRIGIALPYVIAAAIGIMFLFGARGAVSIRTMGVGVLIGTAAVVIAAAARESIRLSGFADYNYKIREHRRQTTAQYQFVSPEASYNSPLWGPVSNVKLTSTLRPNLLLDAGFSWYYIPWSLDYQPDLAPDALPRVDIAKSTLTGAPPPSMVRANQERRAAAQNLEAGEVTLAAYRRVLQQPQPSAGLFDERG